MDLRLIGLMLLLGTARAVELSPPEGLPAAQILSPKSGFTGAYPRSVVEDAEGRLWVATDLGGLFVGDGLRFLKVDLPDPLKGKSIGDLAQDGQGRMWVLSVAGLGCWERGTWRVEASIRDRAVKARRRTEGLFGEPNGTLVVVASGRAYRLPPSGPPEPLTLPGEEADGEPSLAWQGHRLVVNRGGRCWREDGKGWAALPTLQLLSAERLRGPLRCDAEGHLYLLTNRRLCHLAPNALSWRTLDFTPTGDGSLMASLRDGQVWILQDGQATCGRAGALTSKPMPRDLSLYGAEARCLDAEGNLWIARTDLVRIPVPGLASTHAGPGYPPAKEVWTIRRDSAGALWVASGAGLFRGDGHGWRAVPDTSSAHGLEPGPDGCLYLRSRGRLLKVEPHTLQTSVVPIPLAPDGVDILRGPVIQRDHLWVVDPEGRLAVATWKAGHWSWAWEALQAPAGGNPGLLMDEQGRLWLIHEHRVFCRVDGTWEEVPMGGRRLVDLTFPTRNQGLAVQFNPPTVFALERGVSGWTLRTILGPEALPGIGTLYAVRQDAQGALWLNTDRGVVRASGSPLRLQRFDGDLGLPAEDTNQNALLLDGDRIWVGTALGLGEIRADKGSSLPGLAAPLLLEARCGSWVRPGPEPNLTVRHGQGSVVWELGFPGAVRGEGAHFEFREAGGEWATLAGTALQFPEISPGQHTYEVRMVSFLGQAGPSRSLEIRVQPPWYRHPLAYAFWVFLAMGSLWLALRWRMRRMNRRNRELSLAVAQATEGLRSRERDLEQVNRRLYELNDEKNRIIGLAAHDLRNPLSGILLNCELLQEEVKEPEAAKSVGAIHALGETMRTLIQRLLDVHAIEAGHAAAPQVGELDLVATLASALERASKAAERKGIALVLKASGPALARGDSAQVGQILDNFLSNAAKFSTPGTTVTLRLESSELWWRASVQDQGPGLTPEDMEQVFCEYARLSARPTAGEASVGLGLSLVKRMAEAMGGFVGVESSQGQGATFWLELPRV